MRKPTTSCSQGTGNAVESHPDLITPTKTAPTIGAKAGTSPSRNARPSQDDSRDDAQLKTGCCRGLQLADLPDENGRSQAASQS